MDWIQREYASRRELRRSHSEGSPAERLAGGAGQPVRARDQLEDRECPGLTVPSSLLARADDVIE
jgi:hypothetical protein